MISKGFALPTALGVIGPKRNKRKAVEENFLVALKGLLFEREKLGWTNIRGNSEGHLVNT